MSRDFPMLLPPRRRSAAAGRVLLPLLIGALVVAVAVAVAAGVVGLGRLVSDEWHCTQGQAPAGRGGFFNECRPEGRPLPPGYAFDPLGNRPRPSACHRDGWVAIHRVGSGASDPNRTIVGDEDCIRETAPVPAGWRVDHG